MRSLVKSPHKVLLGDGEDGSKHHIENATKGNVTWVNDDGFKYCMTYIAPKSAAGFSGRHLLYEQQLRHKTAQQPTV